MRLTFERRENLAANIWQYFFKPSEQPDFLPGQYADLHLPNVENDPRGASRTFSFTSLPDEPLLSFVLKHFDKQSPYKQVLQNLQPGDEVKLDNAMGDLVLPLATDTPLIFVAGGIGIASFVGMVKQMLAKNEARQIDFFYQLRNEDEKIFSELIDKYDFASKEILIKPNQVTVGKIKSAVSENSLIYISGSQTMVENLQSELEKSGTPRSQIIFDYYDGYTEL